jgi:hypothetical protein
MLFIWCLFGLCLCSSIHKSVHNCLFDFVRFVQWLSPPSHGVWGDLRSSTEIDPIRLQQFSSSHRGQQARPAPPSSHTSPCPCQANTGCSHMRGPHNNPTRLNVRPWGSSHCPSDLEATALTTGPRRPRNCHSPVEQLQLSHHASGMPRVYSYFTVAILAQCTSWADAVTQAFDLLFSFPLSRRYYARCLV